VALTNPNLVLLDDKVTFCREVLGTFNEGLELENGLIRDKALHVDIQSFSARPVVVVGLVQWVIQKCLVIFVSNELWLELQRFFFWIPKFIFFNYFYLLVCSAIKIQFFQGVGHFFEFL